MHVAKKYLKDSKHSSLHLVQKYAWIFVHEHHLFLKAVYIITCIKRNKCNLVWRCWVMERTVADFILASTIRGQSEPNPAL